jgi:GH24 family phage-related lysozyme (muramidase)
MPPAADRIATPKEVHQGHRQRRALRRTMPRPMLIFRPTADELAVHGTDASYTEALSVLRRALEDNTLMVKLRRVFSWGRANMMSDQEIIDQLARNVGAGRMIICSRPPPGKPTTDPYAATLDKTYRALLLTGPFEGSSAHMYLDPVGKVKVGVGKQLPTPSAAQLVKFVRRGTRVPANVLEIRDAFLKARSALAGRPPASYQKLTDLDLAPGEANRQLDAELHAAEDGCRELFGGWSRFPPPAQLALLDMVFNPGESRGLTSATDRRAGRREHALFRFDRLRASVAKENWVDASRECHRVGIQQSRDLWTRDQFLAAAHLAPPRPDPHRAVNL